MGRQYKRIGFTPAQSAALWDNWQKGVGLTSIGRLLGKPSSCIFSHLRPTGGIRPPARRRSRLALTLAEREEISRGTVAERSIRSIASSLGRDFYVILTGLEADQSASLKVYVNPLVNWIWIGGWVFVLGNTLLLWRIPGAREETE